MSGYTVRRELGDSGVKSDAISSFPTTVVVSISGGNKEHMVDSKVVFSYAEEPGNRTLESVSFSHDDFGGEEIEDALLAVAVQHLEATGFVGELPPVPDDVSFFAGTVEEYEYSIS